MRDHELKEKIESFSWYQTICFKPGITSRGCPDCGDPEWEENILKFLPERMDRMRMLDLGCNAGIFCVRAALLGAEECIGIESGTWKQDAKYLEQALFVRQYFENQHHKSLPIRYIEGKMEDVVMHDLGYFDFCLAIASLYYAVDPGRVINRLSKISKNVIARIRDESKIRHLSELFELHGFRLINAIREDWSKKLGVTRDDFYLFHYRRDV